HYLHAATPLIRHYLQCAVAGVLVFDMDNGHAFVKRLETPASREAKPQNIKGVVAHAGTHRLYFTDLTRTYCLDLLSEQTLWEKALPGGCDRLAITPDGKLLYVPSLEKDQWNVVDADTGKQVTPIGTKSGSHNTVWSLDGRR